MPGFGVELIGDKKLRRKLQQLAGGAQRRIVRPAVSKALTPINRAAKRRCPVETGLLKRSIGKKVKAYKWSGTVWGGVGPRVGYKKQMPDGSWRNPTKYAHLVELGTVGLAARPFLRPALDTNRQKAMGILATEIRRRLEKEARRPA